MSEELPQSQHEGFEGAKKEAQGVVPKIGEKPEEFDITKIEKEKGEIEERKIEQEALDKEEVEKVIRDENFNPEKLITLIERQYPEVYEQDVGVWEGYTLKQHTLMVMRQFEKYFGDKNLPLDVDKGIFRLILALHDVGKPEAIAKGGKYLQHEYTQTHIQELFSSLGIDKKHTALAIVLASGDPIGKYVTSRMNASDTKKVIEDMANKANMPTEEFFELLCTYYKLDAGSYTENAGGLKSLDDLFDFDEANHNLNFAPDVQARIDQLGFKK